MSAGQSYSFFSLFKHPVAQIAYLVIAAVLLLPFLSDQGPHLDADSEEVRASLSPSALKVSTNLPERDPKEYLKVAPFDESRVWPGVNLVPMTGFAKVHLTNMDGEVLHTWPFDVVRARLLPNCNLLAIHGSKWGKDVEPWSELRDLIREYDWEGNVVWEHRGNHIIHHDFARLDNGNTIFLERHPIEISSTGEEETKQRITRIRSDSIHEVTPAGKLVWSWNAHDHLDTSSCGWRGCTSLYEKRQFRGKMMDWTHTNTLTPLPENKWFDQGDERFRPGNLLIIPRNFWTIFLIDKQTGKIVWQYEGEHENGKKVASGMLRGHEAYMIPKGRPGAGNIIVFDNGLSNIRESSKVREIEPPSKKLVWVYEQGEDFFSPAGSSAQRLPNGNTLISMDRDDSANPDGMRTRVIEVTPEKEIVWKLDSEYRPARAKRYAFDFCPKLQL